MDMQIHFLRPGWFLMLLPIIVLLFLLWKNTRANRNWAAVIDATLLPHLLTGKTGQKRLWPLVLWLLLSSLVLVVLAGPVWEKIPLPVFNKQSALVIALDLSSSMNASDVKPSRLARARLKLTDLLKTRNEGQTALLAYAATAYTVSPLTDDTDTIDSLVSSLSSEIMPAQGSRADIAIEKAVSLFNNAGINRGDILLITDGISANTVDAINKFDLARFRLSILSVGSEQGAPIPMNSGGFVKDKDGSIVISKTKTGPMRDLALKHGGIYSPISINDADLGRLQDLIESDLVRSDNKKTDFKSDRWLEQGPWLLLLITPLAALAFRRGIFLSLALVFLLVPMPENALAEPGPSWQNLWINNNQLAEQALAEGEAEKAAELFNVPDWKAAAYYKAGQYEQALQQLEGQVNPESLYNRANTLAKMGRLEEALAGYDQVLQQQNDHPDALYNRNLVEQALKQQQQQQQQQQDTQNQKSDQNQQDAQSKQGDQEQQSDQKQEQTDTSDSGQQGQQSSSSDQIANEKDQQQSAQKKSEQAAQNNNDAAIDQQQKAEQQKADQQAQQQLQDTNSRESDKEDDMSRQAEAQWLRRIPDDPGGLLRNKFKYQYSKQQPPVRETEQW